MRATATTTRQSIRPTRDLLAALFIGMHHPGPGFIEFHDAVVMRYHS
ncbi:MAG: hypothetical protein L7U72_15265 [Rubripirellula sp.]|nr:hypothetical protein [Rubripirellula sp.]